MKKRIENWIAGLFMASSLFILPSCDQSTEPVGKGEAEFQITDAPSDDESISGVFVTVADVKVDGHSVEGFTKQTIDLKAYQEGTTKILGTTQVDAMLHNNVTLVLDTDEDANGNAPGCYVLTNDNAKYKLRNTGKIELLISKGWNVAANAKTTIVLDFDIRKAIKHMEDQNVRYNFVTDDNLKASVRLVNHDNAGTLSGTYTEQTSSNSDKVIVYAYKKGEFNAETETQAQGNDEILFMNAVSSAAVKEGLTDKTFKIAFLEAGDYELHFASFHKDNATGRFTFVSLLESEITVNGSIGEFVSVQNGATLTVSTVILGIL